MSRINPYINFEGNCEEAFNFYKSIFGGEFTYFGRFEEMPPQEGLELKEEDKRKIMHVSLPIGSETVLMGSDTGGEWAPALSVGNNISISISAESREEADYIFTALSTKGKITMPMELTFWGDYFGMCTDKFEINWMVSFNEDHPLKKDN